MSQKMKAITSAIVKRFNSDDVIKFKDKDGFKEVKSWAHTGSPLLEYNLRVLGFPTGIIEIAGKSRSGKTTMALVAMKNFMAENPDTGIAVILSSENRDNKDYAMQLGLPVENIIIIRIQYLEMMFLQVSKLVAEVDAIFAEQKIKAKPKFFFIWDSLGATMSKTEYETMLTNIERIDKAAAKGEDLEDVELKNEKMMAFAKEAKKFAKFLTVLSYDRILHFVMLNHQYDYTAPGQFIASRKSTGGEWVELMPTMRLSLQLVKHEKVADVEVAQITKVKVVKNDFGNRATSEIRILMGWGVILSQAELDYGVKKGFIKKESAKVFTAVGGKLRWNSTGQFFDLYADGNKFLPVLHKQIQNAYRDDLFALKAKIANGEYEDDEEENEEE